MASLKDLNVQFGEYIYAVGRTSRLQEPGRRKRAQEKLQESKKASAGISA